MSRSSTPSRRYGDIIGTIFSKGSRDLERKEDSTGAQAKRLFRERRQQKSPGRTFTPDSRQNSSPTRQLKNSKPLNSDRNRRPPTPDRKQFRFRDNS